MAVVTSGGAIPDTADYRVIAEPDGGTVGTVNEDFAIESMAGDVFLLGNTPWKIRRIEAAGKVTQKIFTTPDDVVGMMPKFASLLRSSSPDKARFLTPDLELFF